MKSKYLLSLLLLPTVLFAQTWQAESGDQQMAVLELFTSEGCGLCPAADRWVHDLPKQGITHEQLIVLGFHIDYLNDKKGWIDRFASPDFSNRQRQLARLNLFDTVYTPEFFISGEVIHNWQKHAMEAVQTVRRFKPEASISLSVSEHNSEWIINSQIKVQGTENKQYSKLYLAVTEDDIVSEVAAGDNAGKTYNHQNLVRKWLGPFALDNSGKTNFSTSIKMDEQWNLNKVSIVAVIQNLDDGYVLQGLILPIGDK
ncbi:MAG: DUF1223 domain-containing protein [Gammaproteobacteria bacterium]|nr:DUF1223 domain-containing protein [Gammaproteobacteria bacterium]